MREGDRFNAVNTNAEIDDLITKVNGLTVDDVQPRAFQKVHLPSILHDDPLSSGNKGDGHSVTVTSANYPVVGVGYSLYTNALDPDPGFPKNFQTFNALGPVAGVGWNRIARGSVVGNELKVVFNNATKLSSYFGVLISASINIGNSDLGLAQNIANIDNSFALAIAIKDSTGAYYCIERSVYCFTAMTVMGQRVSITTLIKQSDLDAAALAHGGNADINEAVLVFGRFDGSGAADQAMSGSGGVELGAGNISGLPLHADTLS